MSWSTLARRKGGKVENRQKRMTMFGCRTSSSDELLGRHHPKTGDTSQKCQSVHASRWEFSEAAATACGQGRFLLSVIWIADRCAASWKPDRQERNVQILDILGEDGPGEDENDPLLTAGESSWWSTLHALHGPPRMAVGMAVLATNRPNDAAELPEVKRVGC